MAKKPQPVKRTYSRPAIRKTLSVNSEAAMKAVETYMKPTLSAIYALDVILFFISDEATSEAANERVSGIFETHISSLNKLIQKYQKQLNEASDEKAISDVEYNHAHNEEYLIYSPLCGQYIQLIKKVDILIGLMDQLWLNGELTGNKRNGEMVTLRRRLLNVSRQVINASRTAMTLAKAQGKDDGVIETVAQLGVDEETIKEVMDSTKASEKTEEFVEPEELEGAVA
ncbi:hypothetical protein FG064_16355 [Vibrio cholerae]|nr:hypothetical protein [Vibrio cholerae]